MELYSPGPLPVIARMARQIRLVETINRTVSWDENQCKLSPGERVLAMVMNLLTDRQALERFRDQTMEDAFELEAHIKEDTRRETRDGPGRPPKDWDPEYETVYRVRGTLKRNQEVIQQRKEKASCFVLIASLTDSEEGSHQRVLENYKDQSSVERSFAFIKDPKTIGPMYLNSPDRVEALGYVLLMALLVYSLMERRVRRALQTEKEPMKLAGKTSHRPTGRGVLERFENMMVAKEGSTRSLPDNLAIPWRVLDLLGMEESIYGVKGA